MGRDKGALVYPEYSALDQRSRGVESLKRFCLEAFISCRTDQARDLPSHLNAIFDRFEHQGPASGILAAHLAYPASAWLVLACDLPFVDEAAIEHLVSARNPKALATVYRSGTDAMIEPLFAIWEVPALSALAQAFAQGQLSPRRVLEGLSCECLKPLSDRTLLNINSLSELADSKLQFK